MTSERREPYYVVNRNPDGADVLHRDPREACNTEASEMKGRQTIDATTGAALETSGDIRLCLHCYPEA